MLLKCNFSFAVEAHFKFTKIVETQSKETEELGKVLLKISNELKACSLNQNEFALAAFVLNKLKAKKMLYGEVGLNEFIQ